MMNYDYTCNHRLNLRSLRLNISYWYGIYIFKPWELMNIILFVKQQVMGRQI